MTTETRVGYMTTAILEDILKETIFKLGKETSPEIINKYLELRRYNQNGNTD